MDLIGHPDPKSVRVVAAQRPEAHEGRMVRRPPGQFVLPEEVLIVESRFLLAALGDACRLQLDLLRCGGVDTALGDVLAAATAPTRFGSRA
jgi:hypothetical protein